jgi:hypothetical protein
MVPAAAASGDDPGGPRSPGDPARAVACGKEFEETVGVTEPYSTREKEARLDPADPQEAAYLALHAERAALEEELTRQQQRQRFGSNEQEIASARATESSLLKDLDRVLTMIRAAEIRRQQPIARRWQ